VSSAGGRRARAASSRAWPGRAACLHATPQQRAPGARPAPRTYRHDGTTGEGSQGRGNRPPGIKVHGTIARRCILAPPLRNRGPPRNLSAPRRETAHSPAGRQVQFVLALQKTRPSRNILRRRTLSLWSTESIRTDGSLNVAVPTAIPRSPVSKKRSTGASHSGCSSSAGCCCFSKG